MQKNEPTPTKSAAKMGCAVSFSSLCSRGRNLHPEDFKEYDTVPEKEPKTKINIHILGEKGCGKQTLCFKFINSTLVDASPNSLSQSSAAISGQSPVTATALTLGTPIVPQLPHSKGRAVTDKWRAVDTLKNVSSTIELTTATPIPSSSIKSKDGNETILEENDLETMDSMAHCTKSMELPLRNGGYELVKIKVFYATNAEKPEDEESKRVWKQKMKERFENAHAVILVCDIGDRRSFEHIRVHRSVAKKHSRVRRRMLVVGCKSDLSGGRQRQVAAAELKQLALDLKCELGFAQCSALNAQNVNSIFMHVISQFVDIAPFHC